MPTLRIDSKIQAFSDAVAGTLSEPEQNYVSWRVFASGMPIREVVSDLKVIDPGQTLTLVDIAFTSGILSGALYDLKAHPTKSGRYQIRYKGGAISNPLIGLGSGLLTPSNTYAVTLNSDASVNITDTSVSPVNFGSTVARGDEVYIAGASFGDSGPFNVLNQGFWTVVNFRAVGANPGAMMILKRVDATDSIGVAENITASGVNNIQKVNTISAALIVGSPSYSGVWAVKESASGWFSIDSIALLPDLLSVSLTALSLVDEELLGYYRVEVNGLALLSSQSGDLSSGIQALRPVRFSDPLAKPVGGWAEGYGFITDLSVQNVSDQPVSVNSILAYVEN